MKELDCVRFENDIEHILFCSITKSLDVKSLEERRMVNRIKLTKEIHHSLVNEKRAKNIK